MDEQKKDSIWLAVFIFLGALYLCPFMLGYAGWYSVRNYRNFMFFVPFQQLFFIGPVLFMYIKTLLNPDYTLRRKEYIHFLPGALYLGYSLIVFVVDMLILDEFYFYADGRDKDLVFWYQMAGLLSMLYYLFLSYEHYNSYRKITLEELSYADEIAYQWIKTFTLSFGLILILRVLFFVLNPEWGNFGSKYWYYLCFSILLMYISISGYSHTLRTIVLFQSHNLGELEWKEDALNKDATIPSPDLLDSKDWKDKITRLFEKEKVYQNPNLSLSEVARLLQTNRNIISKAINQEFDMNFNDLVNKKRAEAVIDRLQQGEHSRNTLLGIALDCGFNSKTTFNRAFKKHTALSPKQYISTYKL